MNRQDIIDLIVRFLYLHQEDALTNYDNERGECRCGQQGDGPWNIHFADTILAALRERYAIVEREVLVSVLASSIRAWIDNEKTMLSHHAGAAELSVLKRLGRDADNVGCYAMTHRSLATAATEADQ